MRRRRQNSNKAMALIFVVAIVAVLSPMIIHYHGRASSRLSLAKRISRHDQAMALARAGILLAGEVLKEDKRSFFFLPHCNPKKPPSTEGRPSNLDRAYSWMHRSRNSPLPFEDGRVQIFIEDDLARLSLNRSKSEDLSLALQSIGIMKTETSDILKEERKIDIGRELAAVIVDWRDRNDSIHQGIGAESEYYQSLKPSYRCRNGPFQSIGELRLLKGFKDSWIEEYGLSEIFTVFGPGFHVNINTVSERVLALLPGISTSPRKTELIEEIIGNRPYRNMSKLRTLVSSLDGRTWQALFRRITLNSNRFRILSRARKDGIWASVEAVLQKRGRSLLILSWKEK